MTISKTYVGTVRGQMEMNSAYITATGNDTTDPVSGHPIDNRDGRISFISASAAVSDKTGSSPTVNLILQGSNDGSNWFGILDDAGNAVASGATSISSAGGGTTVLIAIDSEAKTVRPGSFPAFLRLQVDIGGSASPGWTGVVSVNIQRKGAQLNRL